MRWDIFITNVDLKLTCAKRPTSSTGVVRPQEIYVYFFLVKVIYSATYTTIRIHPA